MKRLIADVQYEVVVKMAPFKLLKYVDKGKGQDIADAAVARVDVGSIAGQLVVAYREGHGGAISFVPDERKPRE